MSESGYEVDRRTFLRLAGFSVAGAVIAGCQQAGVEQAIPFLVRPEEVTPGVATWYATTCAGCDAACGVLAKNRDGRPIKLEGNPDHPLSKGGLCAMGQASLLPLYDSLRLRHPLVEGKEASWDDVDGFVSSRLDRIRDSGGAVRVLTGSVTGPTTLTAIARFLAGFRDGKHVVYDALSSSAILDAFKRTHGVRVLPHYRFDRAEVILSFGADFLGTWISPVEFTAAYRAGRSLRGSPPAFSHHIQVESILSLTGSNADRRIRVSPREMRTMITDLASQITALAGGQRAAGADDTVPGIAARLWSARGRSLVVCGVNDLGCQVAVNAINHVLGNDGSTVDLERPSYQKQGSDAGLQNLLDELKAGTVSALFLHACNPMYDLPDAESIAGHLKSVRLVVSTSDRLDETASVATVVCPEPQRLECWSDAEPVAGTVCVGQPVIAPFGRTRTLAESLSAWAGAHRPMEELIRESWERSVFPRHKSTESFRAFWERTVHDGFAVVCPPARRKAVFNRPALSALEIRDAAKAEPDGTFRLVLYPTVAMLDGRHAHNPWLQELPDPVTKIVWDNYASVSPATAARLGLQESGVVRLEADGAGIELPVHVQPGQHDGAIAVALGYGRKGTDRFTRIGPQWFEAEPIVPPGGLVGKNAAPFLRFAGGALEYDNVPVTVTATGKSHPLVSTQEHHSLHVPEHLAPRNRERRPIVQETTLGEYTKDPSAGSFGRHEAVSLWPEEHTYDGSHWGMAIDLSACTGCSACLVGCMAENNIPVVGKDEVRRNREMTWIRIDRYYTEQDGRFSVAHQPMLCQHCGNAPCETVCPVLATVHSKEGLNQQVYNRCVGTRYCSNNCPYKVRRFNWFEYPHGDDLHRLVLNPDVTVRERGVMEKCSFCVQRIQEAKINAKKNGLPVKDGDIQPACQQSCPARAIVFGDMNNPESQLAQRMKDERFYRVLEETGVRPSVGYMTLVRDSGEEGGRLDV
jgi:molybdopterin-containing oxidoreductase family iron-sulfur binding subunit